jgi:hypothetical protein
MRQLAILKEIYFGMSEIRLFSVLIRCFYRGSPMPSVVAVAMVRIATAARSIINAASPCIQIPGQFCRPIPLDVRLACLQGGLVYNLLRAL